jgi:hypothetical protein
MDAPRAIASFDFSIEDLADVTCRAASSFQRRRRTNALVLALLFGGLAAAAERLLRTDASPWFAVFLGGLVAVTFYVFTVRRAPAHLLEVVKDDLRRRLGRGPFRCTVELHQPYMLVRQNDADMRVRWDTVTAVREVGDDVVVEARPMLTVVRGRAFADPAARARFAELARELQRAASGGPAAAFN